MTDRTTYKNYTLKLINKEKVITLSPTLVIPITKTFGLKITEKKYIFAFRSKLRVLLPVNHRLG